MNIGRKMALAGMAIAVLVGSPADAGLFKKVHQEDLDAWVGMPVEALDTHSLFLTVPMVRTVTESGIEIRDYVNTRQMAQCFGGGSAFVNGQFVNANNFGRCTSGEVGCHNLFYIKAAKVIEYAPTGQCYTDKTVRPQARYRALTGQ